MDDSLNAARLAQLGVGLSGVRKDELHFFTLPTAGVGRSKDVQSIVLPDTEAIDALGEALSTDEAATYVAANDL